MKVLNLYSGLGGNRVEWSSDIHVTAVEKDPKIAGIYKYNNPNDDVIIDDAHTFLLENFSEFDFIWSSPPCQSHSRMIRSGRNRKPRYADLKLYEEILFLQYNFKGKWVVENVIPYYSPLVKPTKEIGRHLFWANFHISSFDVPEYKNFIKADTINKAEDMKKWLGIKYKGSVYYEKNHCPVQVLRNCVHPSIGKNIIDQAFLSDPVLSV